MSNLIEPQSPYNNLTETLTPILRHLLNSQLNKDEINSIIQPIIESSTIEQLKTLRNNLSDLKHPVQSRISQEPIKLPPDCPFRF